MDKKVNDNKIESRLSDKCIEKIIKQIKTLNKHETLAIVTFFAGLQDCFVEDDFKLIFLHINKRVSLLTEREYENKKKCSVDQCKKYDKRR